MINRLVSILVLALLAPAALAQGSGFPAKPLRIVHGFTPGGPVDIIARLIAAHFGESLGQQAIVDGKPGAGGTVGAAYVAKAEPDGYTLFLMASGHATSAALHKALPYDTAQDFTMVSMLANSPFAIMTLPSAPYASLQDLVQKARAQPGRIDYGSGGIGSGMHLVAVLLQARTGTQLNHIPYKGGSSPMQALLAGEVPVLFSSVAGMAPQVEAGKIRMLAVTSKTRYGPLAGVPTVAETVVPGFDVLAWYALAGPKKLPAPVVAKLNNAAHAALKRADIAERIRSLGATSWPTTQREAQEFLASEVTRWTKVIRDEKIAPQ
ncbi:MAG: ABC transporter substrate-binding protein [Betaproteobacteria bacterium RIFCSPLOWO2_12_FULL_66_14]|nr:MAG: ABC transporter substrate-binding protein [Betaproteobacteria bacterium RIFCSPLOWO2_12_FULL_66_14]